MLVSVKPWMLPFLLSLCGVIADYATTTIGLNFFTGFLETNVSYSPIEALLYFWGAIAVLTVALPRKRPWSWGTAGLALASYIGAVNNVLVIIGLFPGFLI